MEYATTNPDAEIFQGIAHEASVAGTAGAIVRALIPSYRGTAKSKQISKATDEIKTSIAEQEFIDQTLVLAQQSKTSERSARAFAEFVKGLPKNKEFKIDPAALEGLEVDLPVYVTEQLDGLGSDIKVSLDQITSDMVNDPKVMEAIRPHMRMSEGSMTISEMEAGARRNGAQPTGASTAGGRCETGSRRGVRRCRVSTCGHRQGQCRERTGQRYTHPGVRDDEGERDRVARERGLRSHGPLGRENWGRG